MRNPPEIPFIVTREYLYAISATLLEHYHLDFEQQAKMTPLQKYKLCFHPREKDGSISIPKPSLKPEDELAQMIAISSLLEKMKGMNFEEKKNPNIQSDMILEKI